MRKRILIAAIAIMALYSPVFAQAKTSLLVQCNQSGAQVFLNDSLAGYTSPDFSALVLPGNYRIRVVKNGFPEFMAMILIGRTPVTIVATLGGATHSGGTQLPPPQTFPNTKSQLIIDSNVPGAQVFLDGAFAGKTPFDSYLNPGTYHVIVRLEGYEDFSNTVILNGRHQLHATMASKSRFIEYEIKIPEYFITRWKKPAKFGDLEIYLDGKRLQSAFGKTTPGTHRLALVSSELRLESDFELAPGRSASIELFLGINIH